MMSKCGMNKKVAHKAIAECHWCFYHILMSSVIYYWTDAWQLGIYLFYIIETEKPFFFQNRSTKVKSRAFAHFNKHEKKQFDVICCLNKMTPSHWLLCVAKNCDWFREIAPLPQPWQDFIVLNLSSSHIKYYVT